MRDHVKDKTTQSSLKPATSAKTDPQTSTLVNSGGAASFSTLSKLLPISSDNFFIGFEHPHGGARYAKVYFRGVYFANVFKVNPAWGKYAGQWAFNRAGLALEMKCPEIKPQQTLPGLLSELEIWWLQAWLKTRDENKNT